MTSEAERAVDGVNPQSTSLNIPLDYTVREAFGFDVRPGSTSLVCANWYHGRDVPSFDRATPIRTSQTIVRAPDALEPYLTVVEVGANPAIVQHLTMSGSTIEGIPCGSAEIVASGRALVGHGLDFERRICSVRTSAQDTATNDPALRGELVITSDIVTTAGEHVTGRYVVATTRTVCDDCDSPPQESFEVPLPGPASHSSESAGTILVNRGWDSFGRSGLHRWVVDPATPGYSLAPPPGGLPQLNTDNALVVDTAAPTTVLTGATARFDLLANEDTNYTVTLAGLPGSPTCTVGTAALTVTGHFSGAAAVPVLFPHLCFHTIYLAHVTLTNATGSTEWGWQSGNNHWLRYLVLTPWTTVTVTVGFQAHVPDGRVVDGMALSLQGQDGTYVADGLNHCVFNDGYSTYWYVHVGAAPLTLHLQYQLHAGTPPGPGPCTVTPGHEDPPVDYSTDLNVQSILASPTGEAITQGPFALTVSMAPRP